MGLMTRVASIAALLGLIPDDAEGMYVGPRARGWDDLPGKFSSLIDRKVRAEISDEDASLKAGDNAAQSLKRLFARKQNRRLEEILDHPELYRQYPELKDLTVYHDPRYAATEVGGPQASTSPTGSINFHEPLFIEMGVARRQQGQGADKDYGTSVLLHELQHKIQGKEGWAAGGNPNMIEVRQAVSERAKRLGELMDKFRVEILDSQRSGRPIPDEVADTDDFREMAGLYGQFHHSDGSPRNPQEVFNLAYGDIGGEIEARDTQLRRKFNLDQRRSTSPFVEAGGGVPLKHIIKLLGVSAPVGAELARMAEERKELEGKYEGGGLQSPLVDPTTLLAGPARLGGGLMNMSMDSLLNYILNGGAR